MQIRSALWIHALMTAAVILMVSISLVYIQMRLDDGINRHEQVGALRTDVAELSNITSDYLLYREARSIQQWRNKYATLGKTLRGLQAILHDLYALNRLRSYYEKAGNTFEALASIPSRGEHERQLASQLFQLILELQNEARVIQSRENQSLGEENHHALLASQAAVGLLALMTILGLLYAYRSIVRPLVRIKKAVDDGLQGEAVGLMPLDLEDELGQLARALMERVEKERKYINALKVANRELEDFNFVAGHDIQEPLRIILNYAGMLEEDLGGDIPDQAREDLRFIQESTVRLRLLVQDLLAYNRVRGAKMVWGSVEMDPCLDEALRRLQPLVKEHGARVFREKLPCIQGDQAMIIRMIQHLVENAIKFHRPDEEPEVRISSRKTATGWEVKVADNGIGIEPRHRELIFSPFKRLNRRRDYIGSGIGLAIVAETMRRHGGVVRVEGVSPQGSVFTLSFPSNLLRADSAGPASPLPAEATGTGSG